MTSVILSGWRAGLPRRQAQEGNRLVERYAEVRAATEALCAPLGPEDCAVRSMPDASPAKWHLAHTTWFFETFVLHPHLAGYREVHPGYRYLFNSYYVAAGERHCRAQRGLVTRPTLAEVHDYRARVDAAMARLFEVSGVAEGTAPALARVIETGLQHEQQHQELILTDIKHLFWMNPLRPAYRADDGLLPAPRGPVQRGWRDHPGGLVAIGHEGGGFAFDNECPRHPEYLAPFRLARQLVSNTDYLGFIQDGGYRRPQLWLSDGWVAAQDEGWQAPLYWERVGNGWQTFTLRGMEPLDPAAPVCHLSYYEADAFARWAGARLPREAEWEAVAAEEAEGGRADLFGWVWQWTQSPYVGYPGYRPWAGALGEYNGKFMSDQWVLRGASLATPASHRRLSYRNFFPARARWQFSGLRLAADA